MPLDLHWTITVNVPQLDAIGVRIVDALDTLKQAVTQQGEAIVAELEQLAQQPHIDPADVQALADQIRANTTQIQGFVPDEAPPE
jgi:gamma-glutamyl:cysteine ligase YbdK (ATP-grasp superfamily)